MSGRGARRRAALSLALETLAIGVLVAAAGPTRALAAGGAAGTTAGSFLSVGAGASVLSMGGATLANGNDLAAAAWNPALLSGVDALQFSLSHVPLSGGASQEWLAAGGRLGTGETRWALQGLFQQEGEIEGRDALNYPTGALSASDLAVGARLAYPLAPEFSVGLGAQWVNESLAGVNGSGLAFDAGLRATSGPLGFAIAARNLGSGMSYGGTRYELPGVLGAGMSWSDVSRGLKVNADFESPLRYYRAVRVGGEWLWRKRVALRAGYRLALEGPTDAPQSAVTFGLGVGVSGTWFDYAYVPDAVSGVGEHRIGLTLRPGTSAHVGIDSRALRETAPLERDQSPGEPVVSPVRHAAVETPRPVPPQEMKSAPVPDAKWAPAPVTTPAPAPVTASAAEPVTTSAPVTVTTSAPAPLTRSTPVLAPTAQASTHTARASNPTTTASTQRPAFVVVAKGETMYAIALRWHTTVNALMQENNMVREAVSPSTLLRLPPAMVQR